ncbi:hypothetical protein F2Q69_00037757 [Brassica cretica]|uniref:Uncharacterized protein n=1 Tax=Brassica cretica TaxID=69181 RepID=A0A8S9SNI3_BRACR|nr:hypothetical protein F2Q69_00037757 [Brassica cretica]
MYVLHFSSYPPAVLHFSSLPPSVLNFFSVTPSILIFSSESEIGFMRFEIASSLLIEVIDEFDVFYEFACYFPMI